MPNKSHFSRPFVARVRQILLFVLLAGGGGPGKAQVQAVDSFEVHLEQLFKREVVNERLHWSDAKWEVAYQHFGKDSLAMGEQLASLGEGFFATGDLWGGELLMRKAMEITEAKWGREHPLYYGKAAALGKMYAVKAVLPEAIEVGRSIYEGAPGWLQEHQPVYAEYLKTVLDGMANYESASEGEKLILDGINALDLAMKGAEVTPQSLYLKRLETFHQVSAWVLNTTTDIQKITASTQVELDQDEFAINFFLLQFHEGFKLLQNRPGSGGHIQGNLEGMEKILRFFSPHARYESRLDQATHDLVISLLNLPEIKSQFMDFPWEALEGFRSGMLRQMALMPTTELASFWNSRRTSLHSFHSLVFSNGIPQKTHTDLGYEAAVFEKEIILKAHQAFLKKKESISDPWLARKIADYESKCVRLTGLHLELAKSPSEALRLKRRELAAECERLQHEILGNFRHSRWTQANRNRSWETVRGNFPANSLGVEMVYFRFWDGNHFGDYWYGAYLIRREFERPLFVGFGKAGEMEPEMAAEPESPAPILNRGGVRVGEQLFPGNMGEQVLEAISPHLRAEDTVIIAPTGIFHNIPFALLRPPNGQCLGDSHPVFRVGTSQKWTSRQEDLFFSEIKSMAVFGNIDYGKPKPSFPNQAKSFFSSLGPWTPLPGTGFETACLDTLAHIADLDCRIFTGPSADEYAFSDLQSNAASHSASTSQSPTIIHIASHGFAAPRMPVHPANDVSQAYESPYDPESMLRSGIVLAGANLGKPYPENDGILTAAEIALMDLSDTELVVLSACRTGIGEVDHTEGVFGLQRAFRMAGVKHLLVSLWKVPDTETSLFMEQFYHGLLILKLPLRDAFLKAQTAMKTRYPHEPQKWAGFVLIY